jgi:biopolymer transport protein ExbD
LTSSFIEEAGLEIEVPESASALPIEEKEIIVSLSEKGDLAINGRTTSLDKLQEDLAPLIVRLEKHQAILKADKNIRLELLIKVMDVTKAAGIKAINIKTTPVSIEEIKNERHMHK